MGIRKRLFYAAAILTGTMLMGFPLALELVTSKAKVVVVERQRDVIAHCRQVKGLYHVRGDATDDKNLIAAGIERATGIMICWPSDNTLIVMGDIENINRAREAL